MLVLSRRPGQKVVFPSLGIAIEVLRSRGSVTKLGVEAPDDVPILRDEVLAQRTALAGAAESSKSSPNDRDRRHAWRNRLNLLMLKLQLLQRQLDLGQSDDPDERLAEVIAELGDLEQLTTDAVVRSAPPRVLLVEDQANERELLATCLRLGGVEVATASNGREAFDYLHDHDLPDLILLDMLMPEVDGPTLIKSIRDDLRLHNLRVFAVTGRSSSEFDSNPLPIDGWFSKPVRIDALLQAVRGEKINSVATTA
ncbi:MAG: response regulator [Planctomycetia bacterium]|nr:response regulator [Planctomycetia bacterium]